MTENNCTTYARYPGCKIYVLSIPCLSSCIGSGKIRKEYVDYVSIADYKTIDTNGKH